jgi:predicted transcriptional regulator
VVKQRLTEARWYSILGGMHIPRFTLRGFRRPREVLGLALGRLEREVMELAWQRQEVSVREVYRAFEERVAYTTLMTTLDRLHKKGLLERRKAGRAFFYSPRVSPQQFTQGVAQDLIDGLLGRSSEDAEPLLACIVAAVSERDRALLDELDRLVKEKKRELQRKD